MNDNKLSRIVDEYALIATRYYLFMQKLILGNIIYIYTVLKL